MKETTHRENITENIRMSIQEGGERIWRLSDFGKMSPMAVAQALSRLSRKGFIQRLGGGLYYKPRQTPFGSSRPNFSKLRSIPIRQKGVFPAGNSAANFLGFTTQNSARIELATNGFSLPKLIFGKDTIVHTRRPDSWRELSQKEAAILDFLRQRGKFSELTPENTTRKLLQYFKEDPRQCEKIFNAALSEPPRVRAMLGAIGQELGFSDKILSCLRESLNPLSKYDFGNLSALKHAKLWQSKEFYETF